MDVPTSIITLLPAATHAFFHSKWIISIGTFTLRRVSTISDVGVLSVEYSTGKLIHITHMLCSKFHISIRPSLTEPNIRESEGDQHTSNMDFWQQINIYYFWDSTMLEVITKGYLPVQHENCAMGWCCPGSRALRSSQHCNLRTGWEQKVTRSHDTQGPV